MIDKSLTVQVSLGNQAKKEETDSAFFTADMLTGQNRKSSGVSNSIKVGSVPFRCPSKSCRESGFHPTLVQI